MMILMMIMMMFDVVDDDVDVIYDDGSWRSVLGASLFWKTPIGPLRFNFSRPLKKETFDREQNFDLTIRTQF